ncbi:MAG TPA: Pvc16 family protein [Trinickia sp.]
MADITFDRATIIPSVSESLRRFIGNNVELVTEGAISLDSPADYEGTKQNSVSLYLYQIEIDPYLRNMPATIVPLSETNGAPSHFMSVPAPLTLDLTYMVVAYGATGEMEQTIANGLANLLDTCGRIPDEYLVSSLKASANESLAVVPESASLHELRDLWATFSPKTYHLTRLYKVPAVRIPAAASPVDLVRKMDISAQLIGEAAGNTR